MIKKKAMKLYKSLGGRIAHLEATSFRKISIPHFGSRDEIEINGELNSVQYKSLCDLLYLYILYCEMVILFSEHSSQI